MNSAITLDSIKRQQKQNENESRSFSLAGQKASTEQGEACRLLEKLE